MRAGQGDAKATAKGDAVSGRGTCEANENAFLGVAQGWVADGERLEIKEME